MNLEIVIKELHEVSNPKTELLKREKFGITATNAIGVYQKDLSLLAKKIGTNNELALELFDTNIYECRLLCSKIFNPKDVTETLMEKWVQTFENWEICDSFCMGLFKYSDLAIPQIYRWTTRELEFEKRAGFVIMAAYGFAHKNDGNEVFEQFFPMILKAANDNRIYVKKAVNWALRSIGKRNVDLKNKAIAVANEIATLDTPAARWIAKDALKELQGETVKILDYPRNIYKKKQVTAILNIGASIYPSSQREKPTTRWTVDGFAITEFSGHVT